jgi:hypothetical protein
VCFAKSRICGRGVAPADTAICNTVQMEFDEKRCENVHEAVGGKTVQGVAVRGSTKKKGP